MNVLIIGSGGREHALAWAISSSPLLDALYCAPGNAGIADVATCVDIGVNDFDGIVAFCEQNAIDFVVVGPKTRLLAALSIDWMTQALKVSALMPRQRNWKGPKVSPKTSARTMTFPQPHMGVRGRY